jgi:hypothetical protein
MTPRRVSEETLGAWLIKGNADNSPLADRFLDEPRITRWCVQRNYRSNLMRAGQPVVFWASGSRSRAVPYGVWGLGELTGPAAPDNEGRWSAHLELEIRPEHRRLTREVFRTDPRLAGAEILLQPQAGNPSFLTVTEFAALREHLEALPEVRQTHGRG